MAKIYYHATGTDWRKEQKYRFLDESGSVYGVEWIEITPDAKHNWLTEGMRDEFETFISIGNKEAKASKKSEIEVVFKTFSNGIKTNRDAWAYNFRKDILTENIGRTIDFFNDHVSKWSKPENNKSVKSLLAKKIPLERILDDFVSNDNSKISWSGTLKGNVANGNDLEFLTTRIRSSMYRPFSRHYVYFDRSLVERVYVFPAIFPSLASEEENSVIALTAIGNTNPFQCIVAQSLPDIHLTGDTSCFPFYTYNEDGTNRRENITDWALKQFREHYSNAECGVRNAESKTKSKIQNLKSQIEKRDIFYYTYAILHHPEYREKYAANLKRELPRIPFAPDFWAFATAGKELADIHVNYEEQPEYNLDMIESGKLALDWRVERMKYAQGKTAIVYNDFLTIGGIPPEAHNYRLGNRSALDWIVDQYKVSIDKRSGITNDPNRDDDPQYIVRLVKKIITVSLRTNEIVRALPPLV